MAGMLKRGIPAGIDCSEIACNLFNAVGRQGEILRVEPGTPGLILKVMEGGIKQRYLYHEVYSDGRFVFNPRLSSEPIPIVSWREVMLGANPDASIAEYQP